MQRPVGFILVLLGVALITFGVLNWNSMFDSAWRYGGMAATGVFFFLLFAGGSGLVIGGGFILKGSRSGGGKHGISAAGKEPDYDPFDEEYDEKDN